MYALITMLYTLPFKKGARMMPSPRPFPMLLYIATWELGLTMSCYQSTPSGVVGVCYPVLFLDALLLGN